MVYRLLVLVVATGPDATATVLGTDRYVVKGIIDGEGASFQQTGRRMML
jgi:hypothetical protein